MTPENIGRAFGYFLSNRICSTHPEGRRRFDGEAQVAEILTSDVRGNQDFESFLAPQGFTLRAYEQSAIGIAGRGQVFVMARRTTEERAPYIDTAWVFERMRDQRRNDPLDHIVVWTAQLWAAMQWFFYTRNDRGIESVGGYKDAFVNAAQLSRELVDQIEKMRQRGAPESAQGRAVWGILTNSNAKAIETRANRFLAVMEEAMLIEKTGTQDEPQYRQTLNAAVEMSLNFERQAFYLLSDSARPDEAAIVGIINGTRPGEDFAAGLTFEDETQDETGPIEEADTDPDDEEEINGAN